MLNDAQLAVTLNKYVVVPYESDAQLVYSANNSNIDAVITRDGDLIGYSGCAMASRSSPSDSFMEDGVPESKNSWSNHDNFVTCSPMAMQLYGYLDHEDPMFYVKHVLEEIYNG